MRQEFDCVVHEFPDNIGLHAASETTTVSRPHPRAVTFVLHGFRDNGLLPDTNFDVSLTLSFGLVWEQNVLLDPEVKYLAASLWPSSVSATGVFFTGQVSRGVRDGIQNAFQGPRIVGPPLPAGGNALARTPDILDVLVTPEGGLRFLINPLPNFATGGIRAFMAQSLIDQMPC